MPRGVLVDDRERALAAKLSRVPDANVSVVRLEVGDVHVLAEGGADPVLVLERKTREDLLGSLRDGRFHAQRERMVATYGRGRVAYVVEGMTRWDAAESGAEIALVLRDSVPVFWSRDVDDTAALVDRLCRCDLRERDAPPSAAETLPRPAKASVADPERSLAAMLRCVDGVSARRATKLAADFGTAAALVAHLGDDRDAAVARIADTRDVGGRRLGHCLANRIAACFCGVAPYTAGSLGEGEGDDHGSDDHGVREG